MLLHINFTRIYDENIHFVVGLSMKKDVFIFAPINFLCHTDLETYNIYKIYNNRDEWTSGIETTVNVTTTDFWEDEIT